MTERETVICMNEEGCIISTSQHNMIHRMDKLCEEFPDYYQFLRQTTYKGEVYEKTYQCLNKKLLYPKKPRVYSPEQLKEMSERGKKLFASLSESTEEDESLENCFDDEDEECTQD